MIRDPAELLHRLRLVTAAVRDTVLDGCRELTVAELTAAGDDRAGDTVFGVDRLADEVLVALVREHVAGEWPVRLVAEGLGSRDLGDGEPVVVLVVDPVDGTRGLMYQKRPGWVLAGAAPAHPLHGGPPTLRDVEVAVMTEIPLVKQNLADVLWAVRRRGAHAARVDLLTATAVPLALAPSRATTTAAGFGQVARFFPGGRDVLAAVDDAVATALLGPRTPGGAACFEDQWASSGGQLAELCLGHDRWVADLRPLLAPVLAARGEAAGICAHPYDLCTWLVAAEAGVELAAPDGSPLDAPLDTTTDVAWCGYANPTLRAQVEPALQAAARRHGLLPTAGAGAGARSG